MTQAAPHRSTRAAWQPLNGEIAVGGAILAAWVLLALGAPWIAPYDPNAIDLRGILAAPSAAHPFGTDQLGRDVLSRVIHGASWRHWSSACSSA